MVQYGVWDTDKHQHKARPLQQQYGLQEMQTLTIMAHPKEMVQ